MAATPVPQRTRSALRAFGLALAALGTIGVLWPAVPRAAAQAPMVGVELERPRVGMEDEFDVFVSIENAKDLAGFQFTLAYDGSKLAFVRAEIGDFLGSTGADVTMLGPIELPGNVTVGAAASISTGQNGPDGDGDLATVTFRALAEGTSALDLTEVLLIDSARQTTEVEGADGSVIIGPRSTATPTPTETPLSSPTPEATAIPPTPTAGPEGPDVYLPVAYRRR